LLVVVQTIFTDTGNTFSWQPSCVAHLCFSSKGNKTLRHKILRRRFVLLCATVSLPLVACFTKAQVCDATGDAIGSAAGLKKITKNYIYFFCKLYSTEISASVNVRVVSCIKCRLKERMAAVVSFIS